MPVSGSRDAYCLSVLRFTLQAVTTTREKWHGQKTNFPFVLLQPLADKIVPEVWITNQDMAESIVAFASQKNSYFPLREGQDGKCVRWEILGKCSVVRTTFILLHVHNPRIQISTLLMKNEGKEANYLKPLTMMWPIVVPNPLGH